MVLTQTRERNPVQLRLWPGVVAVLLQWFIRFGVPAVVPEALGYGVLGELVFGLAVLVWWLFFSRAPRSERWGSFVLMIAALLVTRRILHVSIATGMMGMMLVLYSIPVLSLALVAWEVASRRLADGPRRATLVATILVACGFWALLRTDGITADAHSQFAWRWAKTPEQELLDRARAEAAVQPAAPAKEAAPAERSASGTGGEHAATSATSRAALPASLPSPRPAQRMLAGWPGFRGPHRDGIVTGVRIKTDWAASPPVELWRRQVGPGWSSFAVGDGLLYTQEQRGDFEVVACYGATTGKPVWAHRNAARFWESNAGAGPRGTPTLHDGRVYTLGATGILTVIDAGTGAVVWPRNAPSDPCTNVPGCGFSSSPLVVGDVVVVAAAGRLAAYDLTTGDPR